MARSLPLLLGLLIASLSGAAAHARSCRVDLIPNGSRFQCLTCHTRPAGGEERNPFGQAVLAIVGGRQCFEFWGPELAAMDSDGDGRTNGQELGDPGGAWKARDPSPGDPALVTPPGVNEATLPVLELTSVEPGQVSTRGGTAVKARGTNFTASTVIKIGASPLADQVLVDARLIEGNVPAMDPSETPGARDVTAEYERGVVVLSRGVAYVAPRMDEGAFVRGDVDGDGAVQVSDAVALLLFLFHGGPRPSPVEAADADESARVDISDAVSIVIDVFPGGFPLPPVSPSGSGRDMRAGRSPGPALPGS